MPTAKSTLLIVERGRLLLSVQTTAMGFHTQSNHQMVSRWEYKGLQFVTPEALSGIRLGKGLETRRHA
jgi:hypothetical protein